MKKLVTNILISLVLICTIIPQTSFASFPDVLANHKNATAINYLQENGIIKGYPDGTFKPENSVNRAEFLKIIIEGSHISTDKTNTVPFSDIDNSAWYTPYIKKAYSEGWINGYGDGTFKPSQTINKAEALKILGKAQGWSIYPVKYTKPFSDTPIEQWYIPYVSYAKDKNFLEETTTLQPAAQMTRAQISEIIYRSLTNIPPNSSDNNQNTENNSNTESENVNFTPVTSENIPTNFFSGLTLNEALPNIFYINEVYLIKGKTTSSTTKKTTIILDGSKYYKTFSGDVENSNFSIPVFFPKSGNYNIGIIPGESGKSIATKISVLPELPKSSKNDPPLRNISNSNIKFDNDQTTISFDKPESTIQKINLFQNSNSVTYITRQNINSVPVNYSDFKNFNEGQVSYSIETADITEKSPLNISSGFVTSETKTFNATQHSFDFISKDEITTNIAHTLSSPEKISFSSTGKTDIKQQAFVIDPTGKIEIVNLTTTSTLSDHFGSSIITSGHSFHFSYTPKKNGNYILEINNSNGEAVVNHPIYIGNSIPLIPDFFDNYERDFFNENNFNLENLRQELLTFINIDRKKYNLKTLTLASDLNTLAQNHSQDMKDNNYFSHINLKNETPDIRRQNLGITTPVGENLAKDTSIEAAHYGLMRSAAHRKQILEPSWSRVGIGITFNDGHLIIVEEFSTDEITENDLISFENELFSEINNKRSNLNIAPLAENDTLNQVTQELNNEKIDQGTEITQAMFSEAINKYNIQGASEAFGRSFNIWSEILASIIDEESSIFQNTWTKIGIDIAKDSKGILHTLVIVN